MMDENNVYNPYTRVGDIWVPNSCVPAPEPSRLEAKPMFPSRQIRRQFERKIGKLNRSFGKQHRIKA